MSDLTIGNSVKGVGPGSIAGAGRSPKNGGSFGDVLKQAVNDISKLQTDADKAIEHVELGNTGSIHEAMIALEKADISFRTMMQVRNKLLEAYQEIMRMQV
ncbi:MAG: flagellar hook-basal body complex protein FliE [Deltaproteobacteria bacterium]|nr:flagellar hook-basal body complex protein FliE [Deltaproteobacteria bacterium]